MNIQAGQESQQKQADQCHGAETVQAVAGPDAEVPGQLVKGRQ